MTAPLYDVKARLSEYITYAENGEIVEITKHGTVSAVIISKKDFDENYKKSVKKNPVEELRKWRAGLSRISFWCWRRPVKNIIEFLKKIEMRNALILGGKIHGASLFA